MINDEMRFLENEWRSGMILNPYWLLGRMIKDYSAKLCSEMEYEDGKYMDMSVAKACLELAELFLDCTSHRAAENEIIRDGEKDLLAAILIYLYYEAPQDEQNMMMACEMIRCEVAENYANETDLQRLFERMCVNYGEHEALTHFDAYLENSAGRARIIKSISSRLCPLWSFHAGDDGNIFDNCGPDEILEMAVALLHNCWRPIPAHGLESDMDDIAFAAAALHLLNEVSVIEEQTAKSLFKLLKNPSLVDSLINENPQAANAAKYWQMCRENILSGRYNEWRMSSLEDFFMAFN